MSSEAAMKLWEDDIFKRLVGLVNAQTLAEKMGGILAIGVLKSPAIYWAE